MVDPIVLAILNAFLTIMNAFLAPVFAILQQPYENFLKTVLGSLV